MNAFSATPNMPSQEPMQSAKLPPENRLASAAWRKLVDGVRLDLLILLSVTAKRDQHIEGSKFAPRLSFDSKLGFVDPKNSRFEVPYSMDFTATVEGKAIPVCSVSLTYILVYTHPELGGLDKETVEAFARLNAPYHAWPFVRQKLHSLTTEMLLPPYYLPPLTIGPASGQHK